MKKMLCTLLALVMVMSMMVGCGTEAPTETTTQEPAKEEVKKEEAPVKEEVPVEETTEEWSEEEWLPLSDTNEVLTLGVRQKPKVEDYDNNELTKWMEEKTGIDLQFVFFAGTASEIQQQITLMVAGGEELPDILWGLPYDVAFVNELGQDGFLIDMSQWIETDLTPFLNRQLADLRSPELYELTYNRMTDPVTGGIYGLPDIDECISYGFMQSISWINQKWLENLGLEMPTNIEELHDVLVAFRDKDPNGNGKKDEIPMIGPNETNGNNMLGYIINAFVYMDDDYHFNATDGQLWTPFTSDEYREALKTINAWASEGLIAQQCFTGLSSADAKLIYTPTDEVSVAGVICGQYAVYMETDNKTLYEYVPLEYIQKSETDKGGWMVRRSAWIGYYWSSITADCDNPELAMKLLDFNFNDETLTSFRHGIQGVNWEYINPEADRMEKNVAVLDDGQAFFEGVYTWCSNGIGAYTPYNYQVGKPSDSEWENYAAECMDKFVSSMVEGRKPEEIVGEITYNAEEKEVYLSMHDVVTQYIMQARAKFGTGVWDPNNDSDWNTYLSELEAMGLSEYVANAQTAYTRMKSK